jgi:hypothetical protein
MRSQKATLALQDSIETNRVELRRRKLLTFLRSNQPAWRDEDHPELSNGTRTWVRQIREESDSRIKALSIYSAL